KLEEAITSQNTVYQWRRQYVRENKSGVVPTLTANMGTGGHNVPLILSTLGIRKLTPRETFNVQGFPVDYQLPEIADNHVYKHGGTSGVNSGFEGRAIAIQLATENRRTRKGATLKQYGVTDTRMIGSNVGKSYVMRAFTTLAKAQRFVKESNITLVTDEE